MRAKQTDIDMAPQFDRAEVILAEAGMHPVMAHAVIEFARYGERHGARSAKPQRSSERRDASSSGALLTTRQAARRLGVSDKQIYRLVAQGRLRNHLFGRHHRFESRDLDALVAESSSLGRLVRTARVTDEDRRAA